MTLAEYRLLCDVLLTMQHAEKFLSTKNVMHRDGRIMYASDMKELRQYLNEKRADFNDGGTDSNQVD